MMKKFISILIVMFLMITMFSLCPVANAKGYTEFKDYKALLYDILNNPSDYAEGYEDGMAKVEREKFAYADLNNDGIDELIVRFTDTYVAAQIMYVFTYDRANQQVCQLGALSPYSAFFSSGYVKSDAASNQTPGYAIWPFIVSKIDMQAMDILHIANAYCVELSLIKGNSMYESEYGRFEDKDNDGILYFFSFTDEEYYGGKKALTIDEFNAEKNRFIHDHQLITLSYHSITKNNIDSIEPEYGSDLSDSGTKKGDLNGDNKITAADARFALRFAARIDVPGESHIKLADVDGNGKITAADARKILRVAAKIDDFEEIKPDVTPEPAPPADFDKLKNALVATGCMPFHYRFFNASYVVENLLCCNSIPFGYKYYSGEDLYLQYTNADPYNMFDYYYVLDADTVKWVCEKIYHVDCQEASYGSDNSYFYNGDVYVYAGPTDAEGDSWLEINSYSVDDDGKYEFNMSLYWQGIMGPVVHMGDLTVVADWQNIDGEYYWTFYSIEQL